MNMNSQCHKYKSLQFRARNPPVAEVFVKEEWQDTKTGKIKQEFPENNEHSSHTENISECLNDSQENFSFICVKGEPADQNTLINEETSDPICTVSLGDSESPEENNQNSYTDFSLYKDPVPSTSFNKVKKTSVAESLYKNINGTDQRQKIQYNDTHQKWSIKSLTLYQKVSEFPCMRCKKKFLSVADFKKHNCPGPQEFYTCVECYNKFTEFSLLKKHILKMHTEHIQKLNKRITIHHKEHRCNECGRAFSHMKQLKQHISEDHKRYKCGRCHKEFYFLREVTDHIFKVHRKINNHHCELCDKNFSSLTILKKHIAKVHLC